MYCSCRLVFRGTREGALALMFLPPAQVKNGYAWLTLSRTQKITTSSVSFGVQPWATLGDILAYVRSTYSAPIAYAIHAQFPFAWPKPGPNLILSSTTNRVTPRDVVRGWSSGASPRDRACARAETHAVHRWVQPALPET